MKSTISHLLICLLIFTGITSCDSKDDPAPIEHTKTVIMYLIADNNISSTLYKNISAFEEGMKSVSIPGSNLVVYWDGESNNTFSSPTLFKYTVDERGRLSERTILRTYDEQNSSSESVMLQVLTDARNFCPADNYGLAYGSHGSGWLPADKTASRAMGDDKGYAINVPNLADVLSKSGMYYDFILLDLCVMSSVEVAYELRNVTDYLVMSPTEVIAFGFPYRNIMNLLFQRENKEKALIQVGEKYVEYYDKEPKDRWGTVAIVKTSEMETLAAEVNKIMMDHSDTFSGINTNGLQQYGRSVKGHENAFFDFASFIRRFTNNNVPVSFNTQLNKVVVYKDFVDDKLGSLTIDKDSYSGLGCYIMNASNNTKWNSYYKEMQWYKAAGIDKINW